MKTISALKKCIIFIHLICFASCREEINSPLSAGEKPLPVTGYAVESLPGGAKITFSVPLSADLLYVKAEYEFAEGVKREVKSSLYKDNLVIEGFAREGEYDVTLYAVAKGEIISDPTPIKITTLTPPYIAAFRSLTVNETFGGINVGFRNENEDNLVFQVLCVDSTGSWKPAYDYYTRFPEGNFSVRGFDTIPVRFGVYVRDRWGNLSDTLTETFKPLFELEIPKTKFQALKLPGDVWQAHSGAPTLVIERVWNNDISYNNDCFHTTPNSGMPQHFSFDTGYPVRLSRFKLYQRERTYWTAGNPKIFELWGSNYPDPEGGWDSWTKIDAWTSVKPSGLPLGTNANEDIELARVGEDFDVPLTTPSYRYYRWNTVETWGNVTYISIAELTFWGSIVE
ncbi:MAG: DUF5126 domain-containing protein [Tannerella sp.]|jgi:hypothetical protein|nr:DUF5126 domain-containing protein [Tannerella sp.]